MPTKHSILTLALVVLGSMTQAHDFDIYIPFDKACVYQNPLTETYDETACDAERLWFWRLASQARDHLAFEDEAACMERFQLLGGVNEPSAEIIRLCSVILAGNPYNTPFRHSKVAVESP